MRPLPRILAVARADIDRIFDWLNQRSPRGAVAWYEALFETAEKIADDPNRYPIISEARRRWSRDIREATFKTRRGNRYRIVFEVADLEVCILRIRGSGQPPLRQRDLPTV